MYLSRRECCTVSLRPNLLLFFRPINLSYKSQFKNLKINSSQLYVKNILLELIMSTKIYVGNLGYSVANDTLAEKFAEFGTVQSAKVIMDRDTNRSKGFGFVEMSTSTESAKAIQALNGTEFGGRQINVTEAKPMVPRDNNRY
jgi:RNA recognition motif-containing protein